MESRLTETRIEKWNGLNERDEPKLHKVFSLFLYGTSKTQKWNPAGFLVVPDSESVTT